MSNALEAASLIMVPSGYEDGTLGSLKPTDGSGDFTFSRGSNLSATRINEQGYIEKGYENLLLQSNNFDTTWILNNVSVTSGQSGYDGSNDAWLLEATSSGSYRVLFQTFNKTGINSFSCYAKQGTTEWLMLRLNSNARVSFNLSNGTLGTQYSTIIKSTIEDVGGGWYRISITSAENITFCGINLSNADYTYVSDAGDNVYIQDAMLNQGLVAYPYIETTTAPVAGGIVEDMPRLDWASGAPSLLLEPSRTNVMLYSEYFDGFSFNTEDTTLVANSEIGPEGLQNAYKITADAVFNYHRIRQVLISTSIGSSYTRSIFAKSNGHNFILFRFSQISASNKNVSFNISTGEVDFQSSVFNNAAVEDYGNGWYRCWATFISDDPTMEWNLRSQPTTQIGTDDGIDRYTGDSESGAYIYGAQFEEGSYPTSYIPTYGVSQTRLEDDCYKTGLSSYIGQNEGTLFIEWEQKLSDDVYAMFGLNDGLNNNRVNLVLNQSGNSRLGLVYRVNSVSHYSNVNIQSLNVGTIYKAAIVYTQTTLKMYLNGTIVVNETGFSASGGTFNELNFKLQSSGSSFIFTMPTNQTLVFPTALSDSECIELTTI